MSQILNLIRPTLAATLTDPSILAWSQGWAISPKLDGIRALIVDGKVMSRKMILIPNLYVQHLFGRPEYAHLDGELICGPANGPDVYSQTSSGVRSRDGEPDVRFHIFDRFDRPSIGFTHRYATLPKTSKDNRIELVPHRLVSDLTSFRTAEEGFLAEGYEGICGRRPDGPYKFGRSTLKEGVLWKLKRFLDAEMIVTGFVEKQKNENEATIDNLGHTKRSSCKENKTGAGTLGKLLGTWNGMDIKLGTGRMTAVEAQEVYDNPEKYLGKPAKFRYFPIGMVDQPRIATFQAWRDAFDM